MPRRNRNALRGGPRPPRGSQPATAAGPGALDDYLRGAWADLLTATSAATDSAAALASVYAKADATRAGR